MRVHSAVAATKEIFRENDGLEALANLYRLVVASKVLRRKADACA